MTTHSCIYEGVVRHRRFTPHRHEFAQSLFLMYVDLAELPTLFRRRWFWSSRFPNLAWFRRRDYLGPQDQPLCESVRDLVQERTGQRPDGPIRLLTNLRYFGFAMNPISLYYCMGDGERVQAVVAEVTNTPWGEKHCYVLEPRALDQKTIHAASRKAMHVSPFFGMEFDYSFDLTEPADSLVVHIENHPHVNGAEQIAFDATLTLQKRPLTGFQLTRVLCLYPAMTLQVFLGIYWQALLLWWKKTPYVPHPQGLKEEGAPEDPARTPRPRSAPRRPLQKVAP